MESYSSMHSILTVTMNPAIDKSASIDHVIAERKLRCNAPRFEAGGGGVNVSRAIARLGGESFAVYPAGGPPGEMLKSLLGEDGIHNRPVRIEAWTRENLVVYEESTGQQYRFGMPGAELKEVEWKQLLEVVSETVERSDYIVASGSLPPGVPDDLYARIAGLVKEKSKRMVLDTSGNALKLALREGVFLIKPNLREFNELAGDNLENESEQEEFAGQIVSSGQSDVVVISRGAGGLLAVWNGGHEHLRAPTVPIKSKVGAGDSMVAGIVLSLARNKSLMESLQFGLAAGAAAVMTPGTELCRREDTERIFSQIISGRPS